MSGVAIFLIVVVVIGGVTALAAKLLAIYSPGASSLTHIFWAAASFPAISGVLVIVFSIVTLSRERPAHIGAGEAGMPIFALGMFWFFGLMLSVFVAVPTAIAAVRAFRA